MFTWMGFDLNFILMAFGLNFILRTATIELLRLDFFHQLILGMRVSIGFGGSFLLHLIVWYCLRDNAVAQDAVGATRAATGFLYIAMIAVFMGECCARFLLLEVGFI